MVIRAMCMHEVIHIRSTFVTSAGWNNYMYTLSTCEPDYDVLDQICSLCRSR